MGYELVDWLQPKQTHVKSQNHDESLAFFVLVDSFSTILEVVDGTVRYDSYIGNILSKVT